MKYLFLLLFFLPTLLSSQKLSIHYYLPEGTYDTSIPTPESFLGFQVGEQHATHDQIIYYMKALDAASDRISIEEYAKSHENRPLIALKISAPSNQARIEEMRAEHLSSALGKGKTSAPFVLYLGYSVHGNEPSGGNASLLVAYYLAASQDPALVQFLQNSVILLDPCYNPDGFQRFSTWVNMHKGKNPASHPASREFNEVWPGARTNHYWFDLNRDWLFVQHPESKGRITFFQKWKPNILTDHHEMGSNGTFFFQPGIPTAVNPLIPSQNQVLTEKIAGFHAEALDKLGVLYYSGESFDDFYAGKGSSYTDLNGCIGILFEQASSRGHLQQTVNGLLSFPFTIRNHVTTSLSTLQASIVMREELMEYQQAFYRNNMTEGSNDPLKAYALACPGDPERRRQLLRILLTHDIRVYAPKKDLSPDFTRTETLIVPLGQPQYKVIKAMFDQPTAFEDSLFYDISTWTLSSAFDMNVLELKSISWSEVDSITLDNMQAGEVSGGISQYSYAFKWHDYLAPKALNAVLNAGLRAKVAHHAFDFPDLKLQFESGSIFIPVQQQTLNPDDLYKVLQKIALECGIVIYSLPSGRAGSGIDLGSPSFSALKPISVLILVGEGVSAYDAGELWHLLDTRYDMEVNLMDIKNLTASNINDFNVIIMPDGSYNNITDTTALLKWLEKGNTILAFQQAVRWLDNKGFINVEYKKADNSPGMNSESGLPYNSYYNNINSKNISGVILENILDLTHPVCYGYSDDRIGLLHQGEVFMEAPGNPYATPVRLSEKPLISGYLPASQRRNASNSAGVIVYGKNNSRIICFSDNPAFRAVWYGGSKLIANAIFFGHTIQSQTTAR